MSYKGSYVDHTKLITHENSIQYVTRNYRCINFILGALIFWVLATVACLVVASQAYKNANHVQSAQFYQSSGVLDQTPFAHYLDSTGSAMAMVLENDVSGRVGRIYRIWSRSARAHTVTILNGARSTTWDGVNKKATFGGSIGDGFVFEVIDKDKIAVLSVTNVVFS